MFIDTHCHLFAEVFSENFNLVIEEAKGAGVNKVICPGLDEVTSQKSVRMAKEYPEYIFSSAGIHPSYREKEDLTFLIDLAKNRQIVAIGEIGIDLYHFDDETLQSQIDLFEKQLEIAKKYDLPAIVHGRKAYRQILDVPKIKELKGVIHSFEDDYGTAKKFLDNGWMISFTGLITYNKYNWLRDVVAKLPLDRIMIETDSPYLLPESLKKQAGFNSPKNVIQIAETIAGLKQVTLEVVANTTTKNAEDFFKI